MYAWLKLLLLGFIFFSSSSLTARQKIPENIQEIYNRQLTNSTWIVPPSTLLAYQFNNGTNTAVSDQTVWIVTSYDKGYFFGTAYAEIGGSTLSERNFVGSVTPDGAVYMTFYPVSGAPESTDIITGLGTFTKQEGSYVFTMQMNSPLGNSAGLSHWSYMISVKPDDYFYQHLPGLDISVPDFISQF